MIRLPILALVAISLVSSAFAGVTASAKRGMVAAEHPLAAAAGAEALARGGNAADAAVAAGFATCVLNPSSCGVGGGGFLLYYAAAEGKLHALDFRERAPASAKRDMYVRNGTVDPSLSVRGGLAVAVPGEVRGLTEAVERFGRLGRAASLEAAIRIAAEGFPVGAHLARQIADHADEIRGFRELAAIYLNGGAPYVEGARLVQADLAKTLRAISEDGTDAFYRGNVARRIAETVAEHGGGVTENDLREYSTRWREPLSIDYRGHTIAGFPPPSSGGGIVLEALQLLEGYALPRNGLGSPAVRHLIAEVQRLSFADRAIHYGDPDFVSVPLERLLSERYARALRREISFDRTKREEKAAESARDAGTAHLSVLDGEGNAAALTTTINTAFGSMVVVAGTGIVLNNQMDDFSAAPGVANVYGLVGAEANSIRPGKRPLSSMSPTIVLKDGRAILSVGGSGGPLIISGTLQTLVNVLDFGMKLDEAVRAPRLHHQWVPSVLFVEPGIPPAVADALRGRGHEVRERPELGAVQAVAASREGFVGAADPRKGGGAQGW